MGMVMDITDQKMAEMKVHQYQQRLKDLANELTISQEKIRKQIAVDLHDNVGQLLASIRMQMAGIIEMEENPELTIRLKNISQGLLKSIQATRAAIFDLSPPQLNEIGLVAATHDWMKEQIEQKHHIKTVISCDTEDFKLNENTAFLLFRSIKELIINAVKHGQARQLKVAIRKKDNFLEIAVEDDGVGFDYNVDLLRLKSDSYGLFSIQERTSDLGGSMVVDSVIDKGTKIKLTVPLNEKSL
jgi:signal transduction histidine kinase